MTIFVDSGGSPESFRKHVKMTKIDHFGGPSDNCQKNVLGRLRIVNKLSKYRSRTIILHVFYKKLVAAFGRLQKSGGGLRPPPLFWFISNKKCEIIVLGLYFDTVFTILSLPKTFVWQCSKGPPKWSICVILTCFVTIFRGPSGIHQNCHFEMFLTFFNGSGIHRLCRDGSLQVYSFEGAHNINT